MPKVKEADIDTKDKILEVASNLFAQKGFSGTSVRDIAQTAEVNLAAINYHFSNKKNLLSQVIKHGCEVMQHRIRAIEEEEHHTFVESCPLVFDMMMENGGMVVNMMRIILSEEAKDIDDYESEDDFIGPPGGKILFDIITEDVSEKVDIKDRLWAVQTVFGLMVHNVTMLNSFACEREKMKGIFTPDTCKANIKKLAQVLVDNLKASAS